MPGNYSVYQNKKSKESDQKGIFMNGKCNNDKYDFVNSRALFVLKMITMSFAILAFVVVTTAMLTRWIMELNEAIKESRSKIARATARLDKYRKARIKHILRQRKLQLREEKEKKAGKKDGNGNGKEKNSDISEDYEEDDIENEDLTDAEKAIDKFDNELSDIILDETSDDEI